MFNFLKNNFLGKKIRSLFGKTIDEHTLEELEQLFFEADLGAVLSEELTEKVKTLFKKNPKITSDEVLDALKKDLVEQLNQIPKPRNEGKPFVVLIVGVNGNGKTTSIAKLAKMYHDLGKKVLVGAADTFRAAAIEQLDLWCERIQVEIVKGKPKSDPAAVAFDAVQAGVSRQQDVVIIDTAGRLHTKTDLMQELQKIHRVIGKALPSAPHQTLLVIDATIGQNGIEQAQLFHKFTPLTGLILTKLDGTAKGGGVIAIQKKLNIPVMYVGVGEGMNDLKPFNAEEFVNSLFES